MENKKKLNAKIGGQALIEGIMMRNKDTVSMAVRLKNNSIDVESFKIKFLEKFIWYKNIPILRGIVEMIVSLYIGYKCLLKSAQKAEFEEQPKKEKYNNNAMFNFFTGISTMLGVVITIVLFMFLPSVAAKQLNEFLYFNNFFKVMFEGVIKISIFIIYILIMSKLPDVRRTFEYHGAEHKTIACFESDVALTPQNVKKFTRFHPRCGTNFIFIVLITSIFVFSFLTWKNLFIRLILKFSLLPLITGIAYELIRLAGKNSNVITKILIFPGLLLQRLTTKEPNEKQIEVAICAVNELIKNTEK